MSCLKKEYLKKLPEDCYVGKAVHHDQLLQMANDYKKQIASRYRLISHSDIEQLSNDVFQVSTKIDGQLYFLYRDDNECFIFNMKGNAIVGLPWLKNAFDQLSGLRKIVLAGELYFPALRPRVHSVSAALSGNTAFPIGQLRFGVFDCLELDVKGKKQTFQDKQKMLSNLNTEGSFHRVEQHALKKNEVAKYYHEQVLDRNQEGLVCVDAEKNIIYKLKPRHTIDAVVTGFTARQNGVRVLQTALMRSDNSLQMFAQVGTGFDEQARSDLYQLCSPLRVDSQYKEVDRHYTLFTPIRPEVVVELSCHDFMYEKSNGMPIQKPIVHYEDASKKYKAMLPVNFINVLGASFRRVREDKSVTFSDIRTTQIADFVDVDHIDRPAKNIEQAKSQVLRRTVYTKVLKEKTNVRKFIIWKTNKEEVDYQYPA